MSIYSSGAFKRSGGIISAICKQLKLLSLKPVKIIEVQFDPFHPNAATARDFIFHISGPNIVETNFNCKVKTTVVCDRREPYIKIDLVDSSQVTFLANNLSVLELLQQFNKHISSKVKQEEPATAPSLISKKNAHKR